MLRTAVAGLGALLCWSARAQSLVNGGFEGAFTTTAGSWSAITFGAPEYPTVAYGPETQNVHGGAHAQRITVTDLGDGATLLVQPLDFPAGRTFSGSVWLRAESPMTVAFYYQERVPYYWVPAIAVVEVGNAWQEVVIEGGFDRSIPTDATTILGRFVIEPRSAGTLLVDDASFTDISTAVWNGPVPLTDPIPARYFGMHVNKWGQHQTWPPTGHGLMRLWNTGTTWELMEPWQGALLDPDNWIYDPDGLTGFAFRMDYYADMIEDHDPGMDILYTMGKSPSWAAADPALPPVSTTAWQDYAGVLGERFEERIRYWEIWNEVDQQDYDGDLGALRTLTDSAAATLHAIDPQNRLLSPNFTGPEALADFLRAGGGDHVDIISWHHYLGRRPEEMVPEIIGVRDVMALYGVDDKPLWNTEGAVSFMDGLAVPMAEQAAAVARAYLVQWSFGVENFNWYCWDIHAGWSSDFVDLSWSMTPGQYDGTTEAGQAYARTAQWLKGATMGTRAVDNGTWVIGLSRPGGYQGRVVWHPDGPTAFDVPVAWDILQVRDLSGGTTAFGGGSLAIGTSPLLLENVSTVGIAEQPIPGDWEAWPQPFQTSCALRWSGEGETTVDLYDARGQLVRNYTNVNGGVLRVERGELADGVYPFVAKRSDGAAIHGTLMIGP